MQNNSGNKIRVLVAPLDWGLGHTTRCFPIIYELMEAGADVLLAGNEIQKSVLKAEFPNCAFLQLEGYGITYSRKQSGFIRKIAQQAPGIIRSVSKEQVWLNKAIEKYNIDAVISDNRFGLYSKKIPSVFITHQLLIKSGWGKFADKILQRFNYKFIERFTKCWIPDFEDEPNLAGELSHPQKMPKVQFEYVGPLSRMGAITPSAQKDHDHLLIIISGPEPQRSLFENIVFEQLRDFQGTATVVRGLPLSSENLLFRNNIKVCNHLPKDELNREMCRAEYIICRSGYSSVMDIAAVGAKPLLIPTPGQTEQEYLAKYLALKNFCITSSQKDFNLRELLQRAGSYNFENRFSNEKSNLRVIVQRFIQECTNRKSANL